MAKINQIQNKLKELSGGAFQKLADAYLHQKIEQVKSIKSLGSVPGANKTRTGTPDTLIILENGKYILAEYTTEKKGVCEKFKEDLHKCFNEEKTGIPITEIEKIVLCHTSTLTTKEENSLKEECQKHGVELDIFGIDSISSDLHQKYPGIARDFLGVEVDTGQIVNLDDFVTTYNKRKIAAPLDTKFYFRENEIKEILQRLEENNLDSILDLLSLSSNFDEKNFPIAIDLLFEYLTKKPQELPQVFCLLIEVFGFERDSYITKFIIQSTIFEDIFTRILDADQNFIIEYIDWVYYQKQLSNFPSFKDNLHYTFLWQYENHQELITQVVEHIYQREKELSILRFRNTILERIFLLKVTEKDKVTLEDRQNKLLESLIESRYEDIDMMQLLFSVITTFPYERRYQFIHLFCKYNRNFEDFKKLPLEPSIWNLSGSSEPTYESYAKYFKSLLPIFNTVELVEHKEYVEQEIKYFENRIKNQKKEDFIRDSYHVRLNSYYD